jgi:hypothetical protein
MLYPCLIPKVKPFLITSIASYLNFLLIATAIISEEISISLALYLKNVNELPTGSMRKTHERSF